MSLTEKPETVNWPVTHYVFVEKIGPFEHTAQKAWESLHQHKAEIKGIISGYMSLYKIEPQMLYRAGVVVDSRPEVLPEGFQYTSFEGGKYSRFILTGSYSQLPEACGRVFSIVEKTKMPVRDGFFIENYVNNPETTPEEELVTEILIPVN